MYKSELNKLFQEFINFHSQTGMSTNTLRAYASDTTAFYKWLYQNKKTKFNLNERLLSQWQISMHNSGKAPKTIKRRFAALRAIFNWLKTNKYIKRNPFSEFKLTITIPRQLPRNLQSSEMLKILTSAQNLATARGWLTDISIWLGLEILYATGLRISELCNIKICDWDEATGKIKIKGKGSRERVVFIVDQELTEHIKSHLSLHSNRESSSPLLISNSGISLTPDLVRRRLHDLTRTSGITRRITPHMIRHTTATHIIEAGINLRYVQTLLGHSSIAITEIYTHVTSNQLKEHLQKANHLATLRNSHSHNP